MPFEGAYAIRVHALRDLLELYGTERVMVEQALAKRLRRHEGYEAIQAIKGVGPIMAAIFVAEVGDATRFSSARHLCSWAGLHALSPRVGHQGPPRPHHAPGQPSRAMGGHRGGRPLPGRSADRACLRAHRGSP